MFKNYFSKTENSKGSFYFTRIFCVEIYAKLQSFIQLSPTLTKLCHIKCDYPQDFYISQRICHKLLKCLYSRCSTENVQVLIQITSIAA